MPLPLQEYKLEQCEELHLVECGERTELEPAISTTNCPRLWGTFADPEDCGVFWKCQDGKANRSVIGRATRGKQGNLKCKEIIPIVLKSLQA